MMRRLLSFSILFILLAALLVGCGGGGESSDTSGAHHPTEGPVAAADDAACEVNRKSINQAISYYYQENGTYPTSLQQLVPDYFSSIPTCPAGGTYSIVGGRVTCSIHGQ